MPQLTPQVSPLPSNPMDLFNNLLSAHSQLTSQLTPSTPTQLTPSLSPFKYEPEDECRKWKVAVNRETAKPLQDWMNKNISNPYPSSKDVKQLAAETGFTYRQIRNWFTNSRRRYELKAGNSPLPWHKKEAPRVVRKSYEFENLKSIKEEVKSDNTS